MSSIQQPSQEILYCVARPGSKVRQVTFVDASQWVFAVKARRGTDLQCDLVVGRWLWHRQQ